MIIKEGSTVNVFINGEFKTKLIPDTNIEIYSDMFITINNVPTCTDSLIPVEWLTENEYNLHCWWQDCVVIKDNKIYQHYEDSI